jgi:hypothetical protein
LRRPTSKIKFIFCVNHLKQLIKKILFLVLQPTPQIESRSGRGGQKIETRSAGVVAEVRATPWSAGTQHKKIFVLILRRQDTKKIFITTPQHPILSSQHHSTRSYPHITKAPKSLCHSTARAPRSTCEGVCEAAR